MLNQPLVSVILPTYNTKEEYLRLSVESILQQSYKNFELIIIDDGSTNDTDKVIQSYNDKRIKYIKNNKNLGIVKSLNKGIDVSQGIYIARMDADDISLPKRFEKLVDYLENNPDVSLVGSSVEFFPKYHLWEVIENPSLFDMIRGNPFAHPSVMFRKQDFKKFDLHYDDIYPHAEDYELWSRAFIHLKLRNIKDVLLKYRYHPDSISNKNKNIQKQSADLIQRNLLRFCTNDANEQHLLKKFIVEGHTSLKLWGGVLKIKYKKNHKIIRLFNIIKFKIKINNL